MTKPFPRVQTNWFSVLETMADDIKKGDENRRLIIQTPFYKYDGTISEFSQHRAEFRSRMLQYVQTIDPDSLWTDRIRKPRKEKNHGKQPDSF